MNPSFRPVCAAISGGHVGPCAVLWIIGPASPHMWVIIGWQLCVIRSQRRGGDTSLLVLNSVCSRGQFPPPILNILHLKTSLFFIPITSSSCSLYWGFTLTGIERHQQTFTLFLPGFPLIAAQRFLQSQQEMLPASKASDYWKLTNNMIFSTPFQRWGLRRWKATRTYFWDSVRH